MLLIIAQVVNRGLPTGGAAIVGQIAGLPVHYFRDLQYYSTVSE